MMGIKSNQIKSNYFIVRLKVDQRAGQLSLPHCSQWNTQCYDWPFSWNWTFILASRRHFFAFTY